MSPLFYVKYGLRALLRDRLRTFLAILCIAFGVMSLTAMQLLSTMIHDAVVVDPRAGLGGDVALGPTRDSSGQDFTTQQVAELQSLRSQGLLQQFTLVRRDNARWLKTGPGSHVYMLTSDPAAVDAATYPLVGQIHMSDPPNSSFAAAIQAPLNSVITRDLADRLGLKIGDSFTILGNPLSQPAILHVGGIADQVPGMRGDGVYYSLDTARQIDGRGAMPNFALALWGQDRAKATAALAPGGWGMLTAEEAAQDGSAAANLFGFMLKGAGILGLFVGGIGVANTLQVVLARRRLEIATLKTLGYRRRNLMALFGVETAMLGAAGGILGVLASLALSFALMSLLGGLGAFLLIWKADPLVLSVGVLLGVVTAVVFGLYTIVRASSVRPAVLLREMPIKTGWGARIAGFGLLLLLLVVSTAISIFIMGSPIDGVSVVAAAIVGLVVLTALLGGLLLLALSLPTPRMALLTMARRNLKRAPMRAVFALIALFMGIFAIGLATTVILSARDQLIARQTPADGYNVSVYGKLADASAISQAMSSNGVATPRGSIVIPAQIEIGGKPAPQLSYLDGRQAADTDWDVNITAGKLTGQNGVLVPDSFQAAPFSLKPGDPIKAVTGTSQSVELSVAGFYRQRTDLTTMNKPSGGGIVSWDMASHMVGQGAGVLYMGQAPEEKLPQVTDSLAKALPQANVINQADLNDARNRAFEGLFTFAVGLASLALVAGAVLIANAVGLAMVERRREMGILKAVGFTGRRVLGTFLVENALLGLLAGVMGIVADIIAINWINTQQARAALSVSPLLAALMIAISIALSLISTALVAWQPTRVRPLEVLRNE
jgi:putative ABC transport system permease protein